MITILFDKGFVSIFMNKVHSQFPLAEETFGSYGSGIKEVFTEACQACRMGVITEDACDQFAGRSVYGFIADFAGHIC
jgi:hypothetical protein